MNLLASAVLLLALAQSDTTALVEAAKSAKAKRKTSTTKVITNADVKKADKSKVVQRKGSGAATTAAETPAPPQQTLVEKHEAERTERLTREAKLKTLAETIALLEAELARLEQRYFEENDLDRRDREIVARFNETKTKLDDARRERDALVPKSE